MIEGIAHTCFVLGCQRSGTTLIGHVLGATPDAVLIDEADGLYAWFRSDRNEAGALLLRSMKRYREPERRFVPMQGNAVRLAARVKKLVLKAPNLTYDIRTLGGLTDSNSIVFPARDPRAVVSSMLRLGRIDFAGNQALLLAQSEFADELSDEIAFLRNTDRHLHERLALVWRIKTEFHRLALRLHPAAFVFRYEDFVCQPERVLTKLADRTGLHYRESMLHHSEVYCGRSQGNFETGRQVDERSVRNWTTELTAEQARSIKEIAGALMPELGYE